MDHGLFQFQIEFFSQCFRVISWDVPQHGQSRPYEQFSLQSAATELIAILDAEGISKAHLVGQSMGGYISQIAAAGYPSRVHSIAAVGSSPVQLSYYSASDRWLLSITPFLLKLYPYSTLINIIAKQIAMGTASRAYAFETLKTYTKAEIARIMGAVYGGLVRYDGATLSCPILVAYGDMDKTGKVKSYCDRWAEKEKRELKIISDAAHNANMDNPDEFNKILLGFLETARVTSSQ
jgi:pimeloyl-ACP methyl ester carboxylesterase